METSWGVYCVSDMFEGFRNWHQDSLDSTTLVDGTCQRIGLSCEGNGRANSDGAAPTQWYPLLGIGPLGFTLSAAKYKIYFPSGWKTAASKIHVFENCQTHTMQNIRSPDKTSTMIHPPGKATDGIVAKSCPWSLECVCSDDLDILAASTSGICIRC